MKKQTHNDSKKNTISGKNNHEKLKTQNDNSFKLLSKTQFSYQQNNTNKPMMLWWILRKRYSSFFLLSSSYFFAELFILRE